MLLTITTTHRPATDLGFLLHKHPDRVQGFDVPFGRAHVFYPEATVERCTAALLLDIDPVGLVRRKGNAKRRGARSFALAEYVNDRPYVASSFLATAMLNVFKSAMSGVCAPRPELAQTAIPLEVHLPAVPARGGEPTVRRLFEPLGYELTVTPLELDPQHPEWGTGRHVSLQLEATTRLVDLLTHLYVLLPVLDDEKHYWVDANEIEKLVRRGEGWLPQHPDRDLIVERYLKHERSLMHPALAQLDDPAPAEDAEQTEDGTRASDDAEQELEQPVSLRDQRHGAVRAALKASNARTVIDLGCGAGALLKPLLKDGYDHVAGVDVSLRALETAARRLKLDRMPDEQRGRVTLIHGALTYRDKRLGGYDAAVLMEVVEHFDPPRLAAAEANVFGHARPRTVVVTTPNVEYNVRWPSLPAGRLRHRDHRFEWTRAEFAAWGDGVAARNGYRVTYLPVGPVDDEVGPPTQMAVFER